MKRVVTRPDFDGIVCAVLLLELENADTKIKWVEPNQIQNREIPIFDNDIIANLPYHPNCYLWFDHHLSNKNTENYNGRFEVVPSAAGVVYSYYKDKGISFSDKLKKLVREADRIDSAKLTRPEVLAPEKYPYTALSMTISSNGFDPKYWDHVVGLLRKHNIEKVVKNARVKREIKKLKKENRVYKDILLKNTAEFEHLSITDLRKYHQPPTGNRFLVFSLYPNCSVNAKIRFNETGTKVIVSIGHSIFLKTCKVNCGALASRYGGGGHFGAGSCSFPIDHMEKYVPEILHILQENKEIAAPQS